MNDRPDVAHLGLRWPEAYADVLPLLRREWGVEDKIYLTRQLGGGRSGALVFFVDISTKEFAGQAILKLDHASDPGDTEEHEAALHHRAIADAPRFAAKHLPKLLYAAHTSSQVAILSTIAGRGLEYVEPWIECSYDRKLESIRKVSAALLNDWNSDYSLSSDLKMPQELLRSWLDYRLDPAEGGRIHSFLGEECRIPTETPSIICDGHWYPNPIAFADSLGDTPKRVRLRAARGHCHNDFHGHNLLVGKRESKALDYYLIDLALYQSEQFLFYDHAYFELATLLYSRGQATAQDWEAIVSALCRFPLKDDPTEPRTDDIGLIELMRALRQGITDWIERHEADRLSFMEGQMLLARVAAGLTFVHRRMSLELRQMAFFYAAANLKDYMKLMQLDWPKTGPAFEIGAGGAGSEHAVAEGKTAVALSVDPAQTAPLSTATPGPPTQEPAERPQGALNLLRGTRALWLGVVVLGTVVAVSLWAGRDLIRPKVDDVTAGKPAATVLGSRTNKPMEAGASLAVLPFRNLNADGDDSFADGLSIDIASVFARTGTFRMPSVTSKFQYKDNVQDSRKIGRALNVDYLLEGTVFRSGDDVKISVNLIRSRDGLLIWSDKFNETMTNVFVTQEKIADAIGAALATPIDIDADILKAQRTDDPEAYELFVKGLALLEQRGLALEDAMRKLERATSLQPNFAAAWGTLSLVYNVIPTFVKEIDGRPVSPTVYYRKAREAALHAWEIDQDLPIVRHALAYMYQRERLWIAADGTYEQALANDPYAHRIMLDYAALLYTVGKREKAHDLVKRAREIDPLNELYKLWDAYLRWDSDRSDENIRPIEEIFRRVPQFREIALRMVIDHRALTGELDKARDLVESCDGCQAALRTRALGMLDAAKTESARDLFETYKDSNILGYELLYALGGKDVTLEAFRYYGIEAQRRLVFFTVPWTLVNKLDEDARFLEIAEDMGLTEYWRAGGFPDNCTVSDSNRFVCDGAG